MSHSSRFFFDVGAAVCLPFVAIWLYEISNFAVLAAEGCTVSFTLAGWLPLGVTGVSAAAISPFTKVAQICMSVGLLLPLAAIFSKKGLVLARVTLVSAASVYIASAYWEFLSSLSALSMAAHTEIFVAGTSALSLVLLWRFGWPRPRPRSISFEKLP